MTETQKIERMAADAMTEKVIRFSVTYDAASDKYGERAKWGFLGRFLSWVEKTFARNEKTAQKERKFAIAPPSLGKMQMLSAEFLGLDFNEDALGKEPHLEAMRVCRDYTDRVCRLMAIAVRKTRAELQDEDGVARDAEFFRDNATPDDFGYIMLAILTQVDYANFINSIRLKETYRLNKGTGKGDDRVENPS